MQIPHFGFLRSPPVDYFGWPSTAQELERIKEEIGDNLRPEFFLRGLCLVGQGGGVCIVEPEITYIFTLFPYKINF